FGFMAIIFGSLVLMAVGNKFVLFPAEQTEIYVGRVEMPRGTTLETTDEHMAKLASDIKETMGDWAKYVTARAGTSSMGATDAKGGTGDIHGLVLIYASDFAKYNVEDPQYLEKLRKVELPAAANLAFEAQVNGPPVGDAINATFRSNNLESLNAMLDKIMARMSEVPGVRDIKVDDILGEQEVKVLIDYPKADQLGLSVDAIGSAIRTALSGTMASEVILNNKEVDLNVRYKDSYRVNEADISKIKVMDAQGNLVPVSTVAKTELTAGQHEIKRFDFKRSKTLTGGVDEAVITSQQANGLLQKFYNEVAKEYPDVSLVFGGQAESTKESMQSLASAGVLALMGIFGLMVFLFGSYLRPIIIMSTIPLGLIGFSIAFFFHDRPVSFMALIGIIGLAGIIVNSGIVLISFIDQLREEGKMELDEILVKASGMRLRAVLVTSLTTISGLLPTAYGIGGSDSMLIPMTLAMAWGLTSGTVLTLIWVPCAYALLEDWNKFLGKIPFARFFATKAQDGDEEEDEEVTSDVANAGSV
ncbi:MAG: efflux RND transporter permease subunit, partial [Bacteriovoracaceae bacterium]|nr:efflux RND transporter permease subunit [Bacteriovoracaceae bacterium]